MFHREVVARAIAQHLEICCAIAQEKIEERDKIIQDLIEENEELEKERAILFALLEKIVKREAEAVEEAGKYLARK